MKAVYEDFFVKSSIKKIKLTEIFILTISDYSLGLFSIINLEA